MKKLYQKFEADYTTPFFSIEKAEHALGTGHPYYRMIGQDSVICCIMDQDASLLMIEQYRPNLDCYTIEMPAGGIEERETPVEAAEREILEEVGIVCSLLQLGGNFSLMMNRTTIRDFIFFGMDPRYVQNFEPEQGTRLVKMTRDELFHASLYGKYLQLAGLGILGLVSATLKVDIWRSPENEIRDAFYQQPTVIKANKDTQHI